MSIKFYKDSAPDFGHRYLVEYQGFVSNFLKILAAALLGSILLDLCGSSALADWEPINRSSRISQLVIANQESSVPEVPLPEHQPRTPAKAAPSGPAPLPTNASRIAARVLKFSVQPASEDRGQIVLPAPVKPRYALTLDVQTVVPERPESLSLAQAGKVLEVFSDDPSLEELVGKTIQATVVLSNSRQGTLWRISSVCIRQ